jgi:hypothetical protein
MYSRVEYAEFPNNFFPLFYPSLVSILILNKDELELNLLKYDLSHRNR